MPYEASRLVRSEEPLWPAPNLSRGDFAVVLLLVTVWAVMWWATEPLGEFPLNDDWVYAKSVNSILETGDFRLSYSDANAFAQAYWGALFCLPFGFSFLALRISTCVLAAVGISAFYLLLREIGGRRWSALVGALTLATNPLYLQLSDTYMTDVSFIALFSGSLWLYVRGIKHDSWPLLVGAFAAGYVALLIRQFALVPTACLRRRSRVPQGAQHAGINNRGLTSPVRFCNPDSADALVGREGARGGSRGPDEQPDSISTVCCSCHSSFEVPA